MKVFSGFGRAPHESQPKPTHGLFGERSVGFVTVLSPWVWCEAVVPKQRQSVAAAPASGLILRLTQVDNLEAR